MAGLQEEVGIDEAANLGCKTQQIWLWKKGQKFRDCDDLLGSAVRARIIGLSLPWFSLVRCCRNEGCLGTA